MSETESDVKKETFTFARRWRHACRDYEAGETAQLSPGEVKWLKRRGADKPDPATAAKAPAGGA